MFSSEDYTKYNALKAVSEFGRELPVSEFRKRRKEKFMRWLPPILGPHQTVCDYGAGSGWLREMCEEMGKSCVELDEIENKGALQAMEPVDLICSITVLEHMTPQEIDRFITAARDKTRKLLLVTNNPKCLFSHFVLWDDITHVRLYSEQAIAALLKLRGYTVDRIFFEDDVLAHVSAEQRAHFEKAAAPFGPMFLSSPYNYWCILADSGRAPA